MRDPAELRRAEDVDAFTEALWGEPVGPMQGVLHVMAVARDGEAHRVIRIGPHAPDSAIDHFLLNLARARVGAILVTGSVLRAEPELRYDLGAAPEALSAWRARTHRQPPWVLVMSRGELPADHPVWGSWARPIAYVPAAKADALTAALPPRVEVVGAAAPSPRAALTHLLEARGCGSVSVEAGPSVAVPLYEAPCAVDELMLSVYAGPLDERARGGEFLSPAALEARLELAGAADVGAWRFSRWRARRGTAAGSR